MCVVGDDKVSVDLLTEMIQEFEDHRYSPTRSENYRSESSISTFSKSQKHVSAACVKLRRSAIPKLDTCLGDVCGPFRITWGYWADGGKPTLNNESPNAEGAWTRCVNDPFCAANAVQGYMDRFCSGLQRRWCDKL
ncbi:hypothetical protein KQX54_000343 [Cotesia glomerata]|uniref:lysozyme n=1 Tax=Cotesia glomerata TaxID=32391 RepID=A0AAV7IPS8_COTGL|nr:hypothetical protein KQX54_000343 [Cotesia glomerata]